MDNLEFCNMLKEAKRLSGKTSVDISIALRKSPGTISDMLNGRTDGSLERYLPYINAIGFTLSLSNAEETILISNIQDVRKWLNQELAKEPLSTYKLGEILEISQSTAMRIANGGVLRLSTFLKLAATFFYTIHLESKYVKGKAYIQI